MTLFRFRWQEQGGHTHVRVFAGTEGSASLGKCGDLVFRNEEWTDFLIEMNQLPLDANVQILREGE